MMQYLTKWENIHGEMQSTQTLFFVVVVFSVTATILCQDPLEHYEDLPKKLLDSWKLQEDDVVC